MSITVGAFGGGAGAGDRAVRVHRQLRRLASGKRDAAAGIFDAIGQEVYAVAAAVTGRPQTAQDVTVEAFREIASSAATLEQAPDAVTQILRLTQRLACDHRRLVASV